MEKSGWLGRTALTAWILVSVVALAVLAVFLPASVKYVVLDWQIRQGYAAVKDLFSYTAFAGYIFFLRQFVLMIFWSAGLVVFCRRSSQPRTLLIRWVSSLAMILLPFLLMVGSIGENPTLPAPWDSVLTAAYTILAFLGLFLLIMTYYLFPTGRVRSRWLGWLVGALVVLAIGLLSAANRSEQLADLLWSIGIVVLLLALLVGMASQVYRFAKPEYPEQRIHTRSVVLAMVLFPVLLVLSGLLDASPPATLVQAHLLILGSALLPASFLLAVLRHGLWSEEGLPLPFKRMAWLVGLMSVLWLGAAGYLYQGEFNPAGRKITFEPLPASTSPRPVVIDTDMAPDDWMALLFLLQLPDIDVRLITIAGTGETHCEPGVRNALGLVALAGESNIPVACGRETPLQGTVEFPADWRVRADTMGGLELPDGQNPSPGEQAAPLLISTVEQASQPVTILALGPLTNLAEAVQEGTGWLENVKQIYIMGGALEVLGNVGFSTVGIDNQVSEWNLYVDPVAAQVLLASGAPLTFVPLDATNSAPVNIEFYRILQANQQTSEAVFVYELLSSQLDMIASGIYSFWDPAAAAVLADESLAYIKEGSIQVFTEPGSTYGMTRLMNSGYPARYAKSLEREQFEFFFLRALNQP